MDEIVELVLAMQNFTDERSFLLRMQGTKKTLLWLAITASFIIGWYTKFLIYQHILRTKLKEQPINILILFEQVIQHFSGNFVLLSLCLSLMLQMSISDIAEFLGGNHINGETFCWVFYYSQVFNGMTANIDGLVIATMRLLYLLKGTWIRFKFGEIKFTLWMGFTTVPFISFVTYLFCSENVALRSAFNVCMGHTQAFEMILLDYREVAKTSPMRLEESFWIPTLLKLGVVFFFAELFCYAYFFWYLYKHDNGLHILSKEAKRARHKTNAQTFMGQSILFLATVTNTLFLSVAFSPGMVPPDTKDLGVILKYTEFGILSMVHCLLIPDMRIRVHKLLNKFKQI